MGLLTDPRAGNGEVIKFVIKWEKLLCLTLYITGVIWFVSLAYPEFNDNTYFSENALLPGLVTNEFNEDGGAKRFHDELLAEMKEYPNDMPYPWLLAKFRQLNLDVYTHNFTLNYPLSQQKFTGQNVYSILRAPRSASTEAIILSVPYRSASSIHLTTAPSIALLLAFAKFCRKQNYWAKDIIFVVTEHEQLGMQAWLEAYHRCSCGQDGVLIAGDLVGRAGSIQAAINLEMHSFKIGSIDIKVEGLNGQLPNLDLVNLANKMCAKEGIRRTFQRRADSNPKDKIRKWWYQFVTLMSMVSTQATGVPTGNHGVFHRFGIEAITLEGFAKSGSGTESTIYNTGRVVESLVRSLNNLLERFHQSFFFYLLPSTDRYISIGLYMPPLALIIAGLFIKAFSVWLKLQESPEKKDGDSDPVKQVKSEELVLSHIAWEVLWTHMLGVATLSAPRLFTYIGIKFHLATENSVSLGLLFLTILMFIGTLCFERHKTYESASLLYVIALIELATMLLCISMHNFSLALVTAVVYVPAALTVIPKKGNESRFHNLRCIPWILLHPLCLACTVVAVYTHFTFPDYTIIPLALKWIQASKQAIVFGIIDSMVYGNWLYSVTVCVLLPTWLTFWIVVTSKPMLRISK
ncbi:glycosylphosphatidylinositol anchor attachment 1 protein isoform X1 [Diprion similis]|uniref:glycosylphosphatidylinositol anchor attachment 1 protein isoform X1 n=1 Tax=Diprion similis TaxID=362088 RepID=UPI001EF87FB1|nr:glycosylphosphatidylinositol anchor attachment 1 protein isoform X1 [Diprion similis]